MGSKTNVFAYTRNETRAAIYAVWQSAPCCDLRRAAIYAALQAKTGVDKTTVET